MRRLFCSILYCGVVANFFSLCRYLTEEIYKKPVIVYNYPKDIKAFYMRLNDDGKTVAAMDVLVPKVGTLTHLLMTFFILEKLLKANIFGVQVGELVGGSQREERLDVLERRYKNFDQHRKVIVHGMILVLPGFSYD